MTLHTSYFHITPTPSTCISNLIVQEDQVMEMMKLKTGLNRVSLNDSLVTKCMMHSLKHNSRWFDSTLQLCCKCICVRSHGALARCVTLRAAHAPGMPPPLVSDPDKHHGTCGTHVPCCMPGSLTSRFLWGRWRGKRSWHSQRMRIPYFCVSDKRPIKFQKPRTHSSQVITYIKNLKHLIRTTLKFILSHMHLWL